MASTRGLAVGMAIMIGMSRVAVAVLLIHMERKAVVRTKPPKNSITTGLAKKRPLGQCAAKRPAGKGKEAFLTG